MAISFDPDKEKANLAKHGVSLTEGDDVLADPRAITVEDELAEGEQRFVTLGMNAMGFLRVAVWTARGDDIRIMSLRKANRKEKETMKKHYDFSKGKRGQVVPQTGKTRVTIYLDDAVLAHFKKRGGELGKGYQTLINEMLRSQVGEEPLTAQQVRQIVREELQARN